MIVPVRAVLMVLLQLSVSMFLLGVSVRSMLQADVPVAMVAGVLGVALIQVTIERMIRLQRKVLDDES
jgi:hypothetical protein